MDSNSIRITCPHCATVVLGQVHLEYDAWQGEMGEEKRYVFLSCASCHQPTLGFFDLYVLPDEYQRRVADELHIVFPIQLGPFEDSPATVAKWLTEAQKCFAIKAFEASAIMCRKSVEALCEDLKAQGKTLYDRLRWLLDNKRIEQSTFDWAEQLRLTGNDAAHMLDSAISPEDAKDMLEFSLAIVNYVYVYKSRLQAFVERRNATQFRNNLLSEEGESKSPTTEDIYESSIFGFLSPSNQLL